MQILVALDESPYCDAVIRMIIDEMKRADITLHLLHIVDPFPTKLAEAKGSEEYPDYAAGRHEEVEDADRLLQRAAARLRDAGFKITSVIREGDPLISILAEAAVSRADLIVLGSHRRTGFKRLFTESLSAAIVRQAPCSVEIVRIPPGKKVA